MLQLTLSCCLHQQQVEEEEAAAVEPPVPPESPQAAQVVLLPPQAPLPPPPPEVAPRWSQAMMPGPPAFVLERRRAPPEPRRLGNALVPPGANAFDVMRLNARAPGMGRSSPQSFVHAVHEWRGLSLDAFRKVRKDAWTQPERSAYTQRVYVIDLVRRAVTSLPTHEASLMTSVERENWAAVRYDYMRVLSRETMSQYIDHQRLMDPSIPRRQSKKRRQDANGGDGNDGLV
jgi:hypothetical protein